MNARRWLEWSPQGTCKTSETHRSRGSAGFAGSQTGERATIDEAVADWTKLHAGVAEDWEPGALEWAAQVPDLWRRLRGAEAALDALAAQPGGPRKSDWNEHLAELRRALLSIRNGYRDSVPPAGRRIVGSDRAVAVPRAAAPPSVSEVRSAGSSEVRRRAS